MTEQVPWIGDASDTSSSREGDYTPVELFPKRRLPVLTNSSITTFRRCPREYHFKYVLNRKARHKSDALKFGTLFHLGLNAWWACDGPATMKLTDAVYAVRVGPQGDATDPFELVKSECLLAGYTARWADSDLKTIAVEKNFNLPTTISENGQPKSVFISGSIDVIAQSKGEVSRREPSLHIVEHKTTSSDISAGSDYWRHVVALDSQISTYDAAAKAMGFDVRDTIYDVIRKPELQPLKATPEESKKYTKPTKAEPIPRLYATQRETDETPEEYRERLTKDIIARPDWYYARKTILRLDHDNEEHARDVVQTAEMIRHAEQRDAWPRSPNACERYRRLCDFFPVCGGESSIDDGTRYQTKTKQHEELSE